MDFQKIQRILIKLRKHITIKFKHKASGKTDPVSVGSRIKILPFQGRSKTSSNHATEGVKFITIGKLFQHFW